MFLSIVIPIYNAKTTVNRCLESIWSQGLPQNDYEVICVDDCSTDNSIQVLTALAQEYPQLRVFRNYENIRAGGARNHGVCEAKGEYILFIDADDYFHPGSLKTAFDYQKDKKLDILVCDFARHSEQNPNNALIHNYQHHEIMTGREFMLNNSLPFAPWKYIFKRDLMIGNGVYFAEKVSCEDVDWTHKIALYANRMQYQSILLTHYILGESSQTGSEFRNYRTVFHRLMAGKRTAELIELCETREEANHIIRVAQSTFRNGLMFLNALFIDPRLKVKIIQECIKEPSQWNGVVGFAGLHPYVYSLGSTMIAPLFKGLVIAKRKLLGR